MLSSQHRIVTKKNVYLALLLLAVGGFVFLLIQTDVQSDRKSRLFNVTQETIKIAISLEVPSPNHSLHRVPTIVVPRSYLNNSLCFPEIYVVCQSITPRPSRQFRPSPFNTSGEHVTGLIRLTPGLPENGNNGTGDRNENSQIHQRLRISVINLPEYFKGALAEAQTTCRDLCNISTDPVTAETDVVVALASYLQESDLPTTRWPGQAYVLFSLESPINWLNTFNNEKSVWRYAFNLTASYMLDADIVTPYDHLSFEHKPDKRTVNYTDIIRRKSKMAVWMVSNCYTSSKRELFVQELKKYISVDIFGKCGQPLPSGEFSQILAPYKFYLSFENSFCDDYITEKFFKLFTPDMHVIPVVRGGGRYLKFLPNNTYINTADFQSARDLAVFLKILAEDVSLYESYLANMAQYTRLPRKVFFCQICEGLQVVEKKRQFYDIKTWMETKCHIPEAIS